LTRSLALELGDRRIRVNAVAPAMVRTMDNVAAAGDSEAQYVEMQEITDGVMGLASPSSSLTGQILPIAPAGAGPL
jgi:NAD(P)-dependent dehydrogenase (short-subunit alcohol dehydrogenase family)